MCVMSLSPLPSGKMLATCSGDGTVKIWDFGSVCCVATLSDHQQPGGRGREDERWEWQLRTRAIPCSVGVWLALEWAAYGFGIHGSLLQAVGRGEVETCGGEGV